MSLIPEKSTRLGDIKVQAGDVATAVALEVTFADDTKRFFNATTVPAPGKVTTLMDDVTGKVLSIKDVAPGAASTHPFIVPAGMMFAEEGHIKDPAIRFRFLPNEPLALFTTFFTTKYFADGTIVDYAPSISPSTRVATPAKGAAVATRSTVIAGVAAATLLGAVVAQTILLVKRKKMHDRSLDACSNLIDANPAAPNGMGPLRIRAKVVSGGGRRKRSSKSRR